MLPLRVKSRRNERITIQSMEDDSRDVVISDINDYAFR